MTASTASLKPKQAAHHADPRPLEAVRVEELRVVGVRPCPSPSFVACVVRVGAASAPSRIAASRTVRPIGPAVSWVWEMGMIPERLTRPTVGLRPTMPLTDDGLTMEPSVSVPTAAAQRLAATAAAEPELEPEGLRSSA